MNKKLLYIFGLSICFIITISTNAQQSLYSNKNVIISEFGAGALNWDVRYIYSSIKYERGLGSITLNKKFHSYLRVGLGYTFSFEDNGSSPYSKMQFGFLYGQNLKLELAIGANYYFKQEANRSHNKIQLLGSIGARFQKINKRTSLRFGVGYPDNIYLGLGWSF